MEFRGGPLEKVVSSIERSQLDHSYWSGKRVLVTGHTGFKGSWLVIWLKELGCKITGISLPPPTNPSLYDLADISKICASHFIDICDTKKLNTVFKESEPEVVFHLAAQALVRPSYIDPVETFSTNTMGTVHVLDALRQTSSVKVAVMVTTDKVYQNTESTQPYSEEDVLGGYDPYSASKAASELIIDCYRNSFLKEKKISVASARAGNVIGGGDWAQDRIIPDTIRAWEINKILKLRNPHAIRPWQHVLEPLYGYTILAQKLACNPNFAKSYNFGPSFQDVASVKQVIELAQASWGAGEVEWDRDIKNLKETEILRLDTSLAEHELGIAPVWDIGQAVEKTMAWYKNIAGGAKAFDLCIGDINKFKISGNLHA